MRSKGSNGGGGVEEIPEASRKIVRSLKEIVSCSEAEIYAMLKECGMDPNEAVNHLLSQDPFHEVKSKREKKKENKYTTESKSRTNNHLSRGSKGSSNHYVGSSGTQYSSSDSGRVHGKPAYKKENGSSFYASHSSVSSGTAGNNVYHRPPAYSDPVIAEKKVTNTDTFDGGWSSSQPSSGLSQPPSNPPVWGGGPGQVSMADIVKMGRPHGRGSGAAKQSQSIMSYHNVNSHDNEWPVDEPSTRNPTVQPASDWYTDASHLSTNVVDQHPEPEKDVVPAVEDEYVENVRGNHDEYSSVSSGRIHNKNSEGDSHINSDIHEILESFQPHSTAVEYREAGDIGVSVSSMTKNMQLLNIMDGWKALLEEEDCAVIIPDHLQVHSADCSHLSFGSFGSLSAGPASSAPFSSRPIHANMEEAHADEDAPSDRQLDARNSDYYVEDSLRISSDGNLVQRLSARGIGAYDSPSISQSEVLNQENHEDPHENQYAFPSSNYSFENDTQLNASLPLSQTSAPMQTFSNQAYAKTLPSSLLPTSAQSTRESDHSNSPFIMGQSVPLKYGNSVSSVSSSTLPSQEVLKATGSTSTRQNVLGNDIATEPALPPHLLQYSQMAQPTNLMGYQYMPQSYYSPDAYQQAMASNSTYHHQPQSAAVASGYGANFGSSNSLPGNFLNQPSAPGASAIGYEDVLNHLRSLQQMQNDNQATRVQGHGSRTILGMPTNAYYQQQQQRPSGFRRTQQQSSQNYGALGNNNNTNFYLSQTGNLLDSQQHQNPRDVQANRHSQHQWHNRY